MHEVKFDDILRMLNDSLLITICDRRPRKVGTVTLATDTGFPRLDALSPALFSPGYLKAIAGRSELLPKIAHSLDRICRRTKSSDLKQKLDRLHESLPHNPRPQSGSRFGSNNSSPKSNVQAHLWSLLQHQSVNSRAWPRWNQDILEQSAITSEWQQQHSHMLDANPTIWGSGDDFGDENMDAPLDSQDTLLDDMFEFDFEDIGLTEPHDSTDLQTDQRLVDDSEVSDEESFWEELDVGDMDRDSRETFFEDILQPEGVDDARTKLRVFGTDQIAYGDFETLDDSFTNASERMRYNGEGRHNGFGQD
ncbi:hypothetical protein ACLMJK_007143 [Lecanora helva]